MPISRLACRAQEGDREAFDELVRLLSKRLYAYAFSLIGHRGDAEDAVQEAWVRAWIRLDTLRERTGFVAWMFRLVRNLCMDTLRARSRKDEDFMDDVPAAKLPHGGRTPEELNVLRAEAEDGLALLRRLGAEEREAFTLVVLEELSYEDASRIANISLSTLRGRLARARVRIKLLKTGG